MVQKMILWIFVTYDLLLLSRRYAAGCNGIGLSALRSYSYELADSVAHIFLVAQLTYHCMFPYCP